MLCNCTGGPNCCMLRNSVQNRDPFSPLALRDIPTRALEEELAARHQRWLGQSSLLPAEMKDLFPDGC